MAIILYNILWDYGKWFMEDGLKKLLIDSSGPSVLHHIKNWLVKSGDCYILFIFDPGLASAFWCDIHQWKITTER